MDYSVTISTPLLVRTTNSIYVTAAALESNSRLYELHALDLVTCVEKSGRPAVVSGSVPCAAGRRPKRKHEK